MKNKPPRTLSKVGEGRFLLQVGDPSFKDFNHFNQTVFDSQELRDAYKALERQRENILEALKNDAAAIKAANEYNEADAVAVVKKDLKDSPFENDVEFERALIIGKKIEAFNAFLKATPNMVPNQELLERLEGQMAEIRSVMPEVMRKDRKNRG